MKLRDEVFLCQLRIETIQVELAEFRRDLQALDVRLMSLQRAIDGIGPAK